jgi:NADH:ubiquinone oxidoreductase subunit E
MGSVVESILKEYPNARRDKLIPILQEVQERGGHLSEEAIVLIGQHLKLPTSKIYGIATFYNQFSFEVPALFNIRICHGTSCHVNGVNFLIQELEKLLRIKHGEITRDKLFSLEIVSCIGACSHSPVIEINGNYHVCKTANDIRNLIESHRKLVKKQNTNE